MCRRVGSDGSDLPPHEIQLRGLQGVSVVAAVARRCHKSFDGLHRQQLHRLLDGCEALGRIGAARENVLVKLLRPILLARLNKSFGHPPHGIDISTDQHVRLRFSNRENAMGVLCLRGRDQLRADVSPIEFPHELFRWTPVWIGLPDVLDGNSDLIIAPFAEQIP